MISRWQLLVLSEFFFSRGLVGGGGGESVAGTIPFVSYFILISNVIPSTCPTQHTHTQHLYHFEFIIFQVQIYEILCANV